MSSLLLLTAWLSAMPATAKPDDFAAWFDSRVKAESAKVLSHEQVDLDGDGRKDHLACFVLPRGEGTSGPVGLVGLATGERFSFSGGGTAPSSLDRCPVRSTPGKKTGLSRPTLALTRTGLTGFVDTVSVMVDRKGPLLVGYSAGDRYMSLKEDLIQQRREYLDQSEVYSGDKEQPERYESAAIIAASSKAQALPPASTWVSWGKAAHQGARDAALQLTASHSQGVITVRLQLTDDKDVRAAAGTDKAVLAADHLELWWGEPTSSRPHIVQLGIARDAQGKPVSVWFKPPEPSHALPVVRWSEGNGVEVDLRAEWLFHKGGQEGTDFTAVFSDSDGKGQETLVSTTSRRPAAENHGLLFLAAEKQRLPRLSPFTQAWASVAPDANLASLVHEG